MAASITDDQEDELTLYGQQSGKEVESPVKPHGKSLKVKFNESEQEQSEDKWGHIWHIYET